MINSNSLSHPNTQARIYAAMRWATIAANGEEFPVQTGRYNVCQIEAGHGRCYIQNSKGNNFLRVDYERGKVNAFRFYLVGSGKEETQTVIKSIRSN